MTRQNRTNARAEGDGLVSLRTIVVVLLGGLGGIAAGVWIGFARRSATEGVLTGVAACAATIQFFHKTIDRA
ncbi:hypothetical protein AB0M47_05180 [Hamadaea sp. NPDC051192]|uniref:hypothetical protein n=1 Tax=Hamadaea sp. NPDC051192 TaxID=3154940 RepID=UPI003442659F